MNQSSYIRRSVFLDEELGRYLAVYNFDGSRQDTEYFEKMLQNRTDLQELFAPGEKSISFVRISRSGIDYSASEVFANTLDSYSKYHGNTIGIIVRDGGNVYMGWTDEERVHVSDDNAFLKPESKEAPIDDDSMSAKETSKKEIAGRYFIYAILQGIVDNGSMLSLPGKVNIYAPSKYVVMSMADGWIEDNRFGTFQSIIEDTDKELRVGDHVLTVQSVTRDDAHCYGPNSTQYNRYDNDRGRGDKNRTYDVALSNCTVYPITCIDTEDTYVISYRRHFLDCTEIRIPYSNSDVSGYHIKCKFGNETGETEDGEDEVRVTNGKYYDVNVRGLSPEETVRKIQAAEYHDTYGVNHKATTYDSASGKTKAYYDEILSIEKTKTEQYDYISEVKSDGRYNWDSSVKPARANMLIYSDERLNLTYLNSVWVRYAITNRKIGAWSIGGQSVDYAYSIKYLNKALEYLDAREKEEAEMLGKYMELYPDWQIDVSKWRMEHGYHALTDARAKKFAKERKN